MARRKRKPKVSLPMQGDWGPQTAAQMANADIVLLENPNPNRVAIKRIRNVLKAMHFTRRDAINMRQYQAGEAIQDAYEECEALSSGGPLKEQVDSTPRPDRFVAAQVDAQSQLERAMRAVPPEARIVVECVCWYNTPLSKLYKGRKLAEARKTLKHALTLVADELRF